MDGLLAKIGSILRISKKTDSTNNRSFQARDIEGSVTVDQSNNNLTVNLPEESLEGKRRKEAADGIWDALLDIKHNQINAVFIMDLAHPNNEFGRLRENKYFTAAMERLAIEDVTQYLEPNKAAEKHRPHVTERLWNLYHAYLMLAVRPALLLRGDVKSVPANKWSEDELIRNTLRASGMPKGIEQLTLSADAPLMTCMEAIEKEIRLEIRSATEGT